MKKLIVMFSVVLSMLVFHGGAWALSIGLDQVVLDSFIHIGSDLGSTVNSKFTSTLTGNPWTRFTSTFDANGAHWDEVGLTGQSLDWTGYDTFVLNIANANENAWNFTVTVCDGSATCNSTGPTSLPADTAPLASADFTPFSVSLAGLTLTDIDVIKLRVAATLPLTGGDYTAEYAVAAPEPATLLLLGAGLLGLGVISRKKIKA